MRSIRTLLSALLLAIAFLALLGRTTHAQDPDYSNTPDILHGQNYLQQTDDLVVVQSNQPSQVQSDLYVYRMLTANGAVTTVEAISSTVNMSEVVEYEASTAVGRMFNLPNDVVAVLAADEAGPPDAVPLNLTITDPATGKSIKQQIAVIDVTVNGPLTFLNKMVMADFTGDGYDDLVVGYLPPIAGFTSTVQIVQATHPLTWTDGLRVGPAYTSDTYATGFAAARLGDQQAARLLVTTQTALVALNVDPQTLALTPLSGVSIPNVVEVDNVVAGNFDDDPDDEEAVVFSEVKPQGQSGYLAALLYDFPRPQLAPVLLDTADLGNQGMLFAAAAGTVHPLGSDGDALAYGAVTLNTTDGVTGRYLYIYTVVNGKLVQQAQLPQDYSPLYLAFGNFDNRTAAGARVPDLQLAVVSTDQGGQSPPTTAYLNTYNIGSAGAGYTLTFSSPVTYTFGYPRAMVAAGDLQGRSLKLGAPTKITIDAHSAPRTLVGVPPMHLDWVVPSCSDPNYRDNCTTQQVVNILAEPTTNWAQFNTEVKNNNQSSSNTSTGTALTVMTDTAGTVGYAVPDLGSISTEVKNAAKYTYNTAVNTDANSYTTYTFDASVRTGFADHVWFDSSRFNLWDYPIIGNTVCSLSTPNCPQPLPLHVQFSGPDQINRYNLDGNVVEWFQPPWEPGNLLSYPWTEAQLLATLPRAVISNKSDEWAADSSGSTASVNWTGGTGQQFSSGVSQSFSSDGALSVSGSTNILGFDVNGSITLDNDTGRTLETLGTNANDNGSSTGFNVNKSAQGVADYVYVAQTYILGQNSAPGAFVSPQVTATVQMTGSLQLGYWVNPFDPQFGGPWWPRTYTLPDVALNHPQRWTWSTTPTQGDIMTFNQVTTTISPYDQEFYYMRGLYVTAADAPQGSQLTTAPVTETLLLQARVYNFSHLDMDSTRLAQPADHVKVRIYGQLFDSIEGQYPEGESFLIGETTLAPIPGFASTTTPGDQPNWRMATVTFDPLAFPQTQKGNVFLRFWVVTWMEDEENQLVAEMAGHGLTGDPAQLSINTLGDVPVEAYSNNAGTYKQVFYLQDPNVVPGSAGAAAAGPFTVTLASLQTAPPTPPLQAGPLGKYLVTATVHNGGGAQPSVQLIYYDGDPAQGGTPFDWEFLPYVGSGAQFVSRVTYSPQACGDRTVYVTAIAGTQQTTAAIKIPNVQCTIVLPLINKGR